VPALEGRACPECGHPNYQHPARNARHFAVGLDRFAHLVLQTGLRAVARDPALWRRWSDGESVLFRRADFENPGASPLFRSVRALAERDPGLAHAWTPWKPPAPRARSASLPRNGFVAPAPARRRRRDGNGPRRI
jgi:hypothetical protein